MVDIVRTMTYKKLAEALCQGYLDMPSGCDGCPLGDGGRFDEEGDYICPLYDVENIDGEQD